MIIAHDDERPGDNAGEVSRRPVAEGGGGIVDAPAANRRLVEHEGERLVAGAHDAQRRCGQLDVGDAGTRRDQAQVGQANGGAGGGAGAAGGIDDRQRGAVARQRQQTLRDIPGGVDRFDQGVGIGAAVLPVRQGALRVGLDQADRVPDLYGRAGETDGERALAGAALLRRQYDRLHRRSFGSLVRGKTGIATRAILAILAQDIPVRSKGVAEVRIHHDTFMMANFWRLATPYQYWRAKPKSFPAFSFGLARAGRARCRFRCGEARPSPEEWRAFPPAPR